MAHPHANNKSVRASHRRVAHILKDEPAAPRKARGGGCGGADQSPAFSMAGLKGRKVGASAMQPAKDELVSEGRRASHRYAKGGRVKKGHQTNIAIITPHHAPGMMPPGGAPAGGPPPMPPGGPPPGAGMPPGMGPGLPPGLPMRARGGRLPDAGAKSGVGRLQQAEDLYRRGR